jgi:hypothetical protein
LAFFCVICASVAVRPIPAVIHKLFASSPVDRELSCCICAVALNAPLGVFSLGILNTVEEILSPSLSLTGIDFGFKDGVVRALTLPIFLGS